jgi:hypothetical protein
MSKTSPEPLIGVINAGSSSVKFSFYEGDRRILTGQVEGIGAHPSAIATGPQGEKLAPPDLGTKPPTYRARSSQQYCRGPESGSAIGASRRWATVSFMVACIILDRPA